VPNRNPCPGPAPGPVGASIGADSASSPHGSGSSASGCSPRFPRWTRGRQRIWRRGEGVRTVHDASATREEKTAEYLRLCAVREAKGLKAGFPGAAFRELFGHWPRFRDEELAVVAPAEHPLLPLPPRRESERSDPSPHPAARSLPRPPAHRTDPPAQGRRPACRGLEGPSALRPEADERDPRASRGRGHAPRPRAPRLRPRPGARPGCRGPPSPRPVPHRRQRRPSTNKCAASADGGARKSEARDPFGFLRGIAGFRVGATGFEPATTCTPSKCATRLRYAPGGTGDQRAALCRPRRGKSRSFPDLGLGMRRG
jgi:hypothetical protein